MIVVKTECSFYLVESALVVVGAGLSAQLLVLDVGHHPVHVLLAWHESLNNLLKILVSSDWSCCC